MARRAAPVLSRRPRMPRALVPLLVAVLLASSLTAAPPAAADEPSAHQPPVDAAVSDAFRAPEDPWGAGNRGLEYATTPGTPVAATADGVVAFAGWVAGSQHVTVRHDGGIRTSYSYLAEVHVVVGQRVRQGDVLGTTEGRLHLGARIGDQYFDPAALFHAGPPRVHLVPFELPLGLGQPGERSAIRQLIGGIGGALGDAASWVAGEAIDRVGGALGLSMGWVREHWPALLRTIGHYAVPYVWRIGQAGYRVLRDAHRVASQVCTPRWVEPVPLIERRVAIRIGGLGSTSEDAAIDDLDLAALGYAEADVARFSYRGGTTPNRGATFEGMPGEAYLSSDTQVDLWESGRALADLVEDAVAAADGAPVDLFAHSQGGLVLRTAVVALEARHGRAWLAEHLGRSVTLGTPHGGADLATGLFALQAFGWADRALGAGERWLGLDAGSLAAVQLAETSDFQRELEEAWPADAIDLTSIAARGDLVVAVPRTRVGGASHVVVAVDGVSAHDALPGSDEAAREVALAVAGQPPTCRSFRGALLDGAVGEGISLATDGLFGPVLSGLASQLVPD